MTSRMFTRAFGLERASVNTDTGEFRGVLVTDGEASDGHILSIEGGDIPEQMPFFVNHSADPRTQLGSLYFDGKTEHQVRVRGQVMVNGEGSEADIRRDLVAKMAAGHVSRLSVRWDAFSEDMTPRTELPAEHPAHVNEKKAKKDWRFRYGLFFKSWTAQEGSLVGLGADPAAVLRCATDPNLSEPVRAFWRSAAIDAMQAPAEDAIAQLAMRLRDELSEVLVPLVARVNALEQMREVPVTEPDPDSPSTEGDTQAEEAPGAAGGTSAEGDADDARSRESLEAPASPRKRWDPEEIAEALAISIRRRDAEFDQEIDALVDRARGKVT